MRKSNNSKNEITDMGLIIINRLPGWEEKKEEFFNILFGPDEQHCLVFKYVYGRFTHDMHKAKDFVQYYAKIIVKRICSVKYDEHGIPIPVKINYDPSESHNPDHPPFINYFINSTMLNRRFIDFRRWGQKHMKNCHERNESELTNDLSEEDRKSNFTDQTSTAHFNKRKSRERCNAIFNDVVIPLFLKKLDDKTKKLTSSKKLPEVNNNHIMAVFQLYPHISGCEAYVDGCGKYDVDEFGWIHCRSPFKYSRDGLRRVKDLTFQRLKNYNPDIPPEKAMLECHRQSRRYGLCEKQKLLSLREILDINFAPIDESQALGRLGFDATEKSRYLNKVEVWFCNSSIHIQESLE